jgi:hypothetical protein
MIIVSTKEARKINKFLGIDQVFPRGITPLLGGARGGLYPNLIIQLTKVGRINVQIRCDILVRHQLKHMRASLGKSPETLFNGQGM